MSTIGEPSGGLEPPNGSADDALVLFSVDGNRQRLDGGAMFGNCPREVWQRWAAPDRQNRIELACRCLLVRHMPDREPASSPATPKGPRLVVSPSDTPRARTVLLEAGIGAFFPPPLRARYGIDSQRHVLLDSLRALGVEPDDVDVVVLSHLHFDHAGGLLSRWVPETSPCLVFPRAHYVVGKTAWERACRPHARDRASFIPELQPLLESTGRLHLVDGAHSPLLGPTYEFSFSEGHTPGLMLTTVWGPQRPLTFLSDLVPGAAWVHLPITMGYDRFPERIIEEKEAMLQRIRQADGWAFFTHDPVTAAARIDVDERGRFVTRDPQSSVAWSDPP